MGIETRGKSLVVVGAGGNIGSHLVPHLARIACIDRVLLIDPDSYESSNLRSQDIFPEDVGRPKVIVQARRMSRINPALKAKALPEAVENVPLGRLRADVILSCLDSRLARQRVSQYAWRLGIPLIDAGVEPSALLARINVYFPGGTTPCLECAWDDRDYAAIEQTYSCDGLVPATSFGTNAPSGLGGLVASLQAIECHKLLENRVGLLAGGRQVLIDASHHRHYVTSFRRNPHCRFDHGIWKIQKLNAYGGRTALSQILEIARAVVDGKESRSIRIEGNRFVKRLTCPTCGREKRTLKLERSLTAPEWACGCGQRMAAAGFDLFERLDGAMLASDAGSLSLAAAGLRNCDVLTVESRDNELHFELAFAELSIS